MAAVGVSAYRRVAAVGAGGKARQKAALLDDDSCRAGQRAAGSLVARSRLLVSAVGTGHRTGLLRLWRGGPARRAANQSARGAWVAVAVTRL